MIAFPIAPCCYLMPGFAQGAYTPHRFAIKVRRNSVGKKCLFGYSLQLHSKAGIRYIDLIVWRWSAWIQKVRA
jgi:hypothetical protein